MNLHPRRAYRKSASRYDKAKAEAHKTLDRAKAGHPVTPKQIECALRITGDLT